MTLSLLLPAVVIVFTLVTLTVSMRRVEHELVFLRRSLRRCRATAVAADELSRLSAAVATRAGEIDTDARSRLDRTRSRRRPTAR